MNISVNLTNPFVLIFLCGTVATFLINHFLEFIDFRARAKNGGSIPEILQKIPLAAETFDTEKLKKISAYEDAKYFKWCVSSVFTIVLELALVIFGFYPFVFNFILLSLILSAALQAFLQQLETASWPFFCS